MPISATCRQCGRTYRIPSAQAGKRLACKDCGAVIIVPGASNTIAAEAPRPLRSEARSVADDTSRVPEAVYRKMIAGSTALASHPAMAPINYFQLFFCFPQKPIQAISLAALGAAISIAINNVIPFLVIAALASIPLIKMARRIRRILITGCTNPGIIVAKNPWTVAVYTDLTTGGATRPAVKVQTWPMWKMGGGPPKVGMRVAAPSTYAQGPDSSAWLTFVPIVLNMVTRNPAVISRCLNMIPTEDWESLQAWVKRNPSPQPGLYRLWPGGHNAMAKYKRFNRDQIKTFLWVLHAMAVVPAAIGIRKAVEDKQASDNTPMIFTPVAKPPVQPMVQPQSSQSPLTPQGTAPPAEDPAQVMRDAQQKAFQMQQEQIKKMQDQFDAMRQQKAPGAQPGGR